MSAYPERLYPVELREIVIASPVGACNCRKQVMDAVIRCACLRFCLFVCLFVRSFVCVNLPTASTAELCAWHISEVVLVPCFNLYWIFAYAANGTHKTLTYATAATLYISVEYNSVSCIL
jgi:hypothetical protein